MFSALPSKSFTESTAASVQEGGFNVAAQLVGAGGRVDYFNEKAVWSEPDSWFETADAYYYPSAPLSFYAVHPVAVPIEYISSPGGNLPVLNYSSDHDTDLIVAVEENVIASSGGVALSFVHLLSQIKVLWTGEDPKVNYALTTLDLVNPAAGTYRFQDASWTVMTQQTTPLQAGVPVSVIPAQLTLRICWDCLQNGVKVASYDKSVQFTPGAGKICTVNCTLPNADAKTISFSVNVTPWGSEDRNLTLASLHRADRAPVSFDAGAVSSLDLCVFRSDGSLDTYCRRSGSVLTSTLPMNEDLYYYLVANAPEGLLAGIRTEAQLLSSKAWLKDNARSAFILTASGHGCFRGPSEEHLGMERTVCKVSVGRITPTFLGKGMMGGVTATLDKVWLINAPGSIPLSLQPSGADMLNYGNYDSSIPAPLADLLSCSPVMTLDGPTSRELDLSFYCCPNPVAGTRLVLELSIGGEKNYYPVTLPPMKCNYEYRAEEVELLGWGSASPDIPVERDALRWAVNVNPWGNEEKNFIMT